MFASPNDAIVFGLKTSHVRFHTWIDDLKPTEFYHQPLLGVNSIAWIIGHLTLTDRRILSIFDVPLPALPAGFEDLYKPTRQAAGTQTGLSSVSDLVTALDTHRQLLIETVQKADVATLNKPITGFGPLVKIAGEAAAFMSVHLAMHAGQITLIRRSLGYPPVM